MTDEGLLAWGSCLTFFPYTDASGTKRRPALVVLDTGDEDILVARLTSQAPQTVFDVELVEWKQAGLLLLSVVRTDKVATLEKRLVERRLGARTTKDGEQVRRKIQELWNFI